MIDGDETVHANMPVNNDDHDSESTGVIDDDHDSENTGVVDGDECTELVTDKEAEGSLCRANDYNRYDCRIGRIGIRSSGSDGHFHFIVLIKYHTIQIG